MDVEDLSKTAFTKCSTKVAFTSSQYEVFLETHDSKTMKWYTDILPRETREALHALAPKSWIRDEGWYLAGGTALALAVGHRSSVDLDFFTQKKTFNPTDVINHFESPDWQTDVQEQSTLYGRLLGAKISFIAYPFFKPLLSPNQFGSVPVLKPQDIATMKIVAISQRGRKRDFVDLYWYVHHREPLVEVIKRLPMQYPSVAHDYHHILKSLTYFVDAEDDVMPPLTFQAKWPDIKKFFLQETKRMVPQLLHLL